MGFLCKEEGIWVWDCALTQKSWRFMRRWHGLCFTLTNSQRPLFSCAEESGVDSPCFGVFLLALPGVTPGRKDELLEVLVFLKELVTLQWMFKLEVLGREGGPVFFLRGRIWVVYFDGGLRKGCFRLSITFSGYVFILSVKLSSPQKKN